MMNPVRTAFDMNRVRLPALARPNPSWKSPTRSVRTKRVAGTSLSGTGARMEKSETAMTFESITLRNEEPVRSAPNAVENAAV
ncbi:MAG: hypothetical protein BWX50_01187 [Euryarchaeota archaeon ADurb.Bin009]|nr:MAG: hypothetical protein BWX50_01187 [Euryarchaeota archaeon ADurb.Bin009]